MKKILFFLTALFFCASLSAQIPFTLQLFQNPSGGSIDDYPVWLRVVPPAGSAYVVQGYTYANGAFTDTLGVPIGSQVISMTYDCGGNLVSDTTLASWGGDTLILCPGPVYRSGCNPDFRIVNSASSGLSVTLSDSTDILGVSGAQETYIWSYGDGNSDTTFTIGGTMNHTYLAPGVYQICLDAYIYDPVAQLTICQSTKCQTITAGSPAGTCAQPTLFDTLVPQQLHQVDFTVQTNSPFLQGSFYIYKYHFGDGDSATTGLLSNPWGGVTHTYPGAGTYNVTVTEYRINSFGDTICSDITSKSITLQASGTCTADFGAMGLNANVQVRDSSSYSLPAGGIARYIIDYGDGTVDTSNTPINNHNYISSGTFPICYTLEIIDSASGSVICSDTRCRNFTVNYQCNLSVRDSSVFNSSIGFFRISSYAGGAGTTVYTSIHFGDGDSLINPPSGYFSHTYPSTGSYNYVVNLVVVSSNGDTVCTDNHLGAISVGSNNYSCQANFVPVVNPGSATVNFIDSSLVPSGSAVDSIYYRWDFGDGNFSTQPNPTHTYNFAATYTVCLDLYITNTNQDTICTSSRCDSVVISTGPNIICQAGFTSSADTINPFTYDFNNQSSVTGAPASSTTIYTWDYGDGTSGTSNSHTYTAAGSYFVCLELAVIGSNGTDTLCLSTFCDSITIAPAPNVTCQASFTSQPDSIDPYTYDFSNQSSVTGAPVNSSVIYTWNYGDGISGTSTSHTYSAAGTYNVCLNVLVLGVNSTDTLCQSIICNNLTVTAPTPFCEASYIVDTANSFLGNVYIWNMSDPAYSDTAYSNSYTWDFGDGNGSHQAFPVHTYSDPGMYGVCLTISSVDQNQQTCTSTFCDTLGVDSLGNLLYKNSNTGFTLNVLNPETIGLDETNPLAEVQLYPNPANDLVTIDFGTYRDDIKWSITDLKGSLIREGRASKQEEITINVEKLRNGLYILTLMNEELPVIHHKLIIDR